jgi:myo-inositol 2-dehydrogenase/D-chiro-inositol 1-dehydrogenase
MIENARLHGVRLMIGHSRRFTGRYLVLKDAVLRGEVGEVIAIRENERRSRPRNPGEGTYWSSSHWTGDPLHSVGAILTNGIHEVDLFNWFFADEPVSVYAEHRVTREGGRVPDFISFTVRYQGGGIGSSEVNNALPPGYPGFHAFELFGTTGMLSARDSEMRRVELFGPDGAMRDPWAYEHLLHVEEAYVREHRAFAESVREGKPLPVTPEEARLALAVALAADRSARSGQPEPVAPGPETPELRREGGGRP